MCGFAGFANFHEDLNPNYYKDIIQNMSQVLEKRGPDEGFSISSKHVNLMHRRLIIVDAENGKQPMTIHYEGITYTLIYNGQLYNTNELRQELKDCGFDFIGYSDTEVLLKAYIYYGSSVLEKLNGIFSFAIWNEQKEELFLARDHFGIKPLFYTIINNTLVFGSEIKALLEFPNVHTKLNSTSICELFGLGPAHTPGTTVFKDIFELKPAHFAIFNSSGLHIDCYWNLESKPHTDDFKTTCDTVHFLLEDSITRQLVSDVPLCCMLSGGLDSSIITAYASNFYKKNGYSNLDTFSVDYVDNDKNFVKSDFQPNSDNYYIDIMRNKFNTNHRTIMIDTPELASYLKEAMIARDVPGMADVDSSLLLFCKGIKENATVALSGECSDEIFAGYPWFFREDALNSNTFPWSIALSERQNLLNKDIAKYVDLKEYVDMRYEDELAKIKFLDVDSKDTKEKRKISFLTMNWFMQTLLDRTDRMSMYTGLEVRVPFCDYRLVQYMWNVPWHMKAFEGREKGLLRYVVKDLLPKEIVERKKSPYPKTHNPSYLKAAKQMLTDIMNKPDAPITSLLNKDYILDILNTDGKSFTRPWFGQLMIRMSVKSTFLKLALYQFSLFKLKFY